ncbi:hypothetical protein EGK_21522, partial [Macaca mulatta]
VRAPHCLPAMEPDPKGPTAPGLTAIPEGWFHQTCSLWSGQALSLLHDQHSHYQNLLVFCSKTYSNALVLDGIIPGTERDEFFCQEMVAILPLCSHPNPRKPLQPRPLRAEMRVLHKVGKHLCLESVVQCNIDKDVIQVSQKFLPGTASCYSSSKLTLHVGDRFEFMKQNAFDVITDFSDHMGPAESLFKEAYCQRMKVALVEDGILCCQRARQWLHLHLIIAVVGYTDCMVPIYPCGQTGFMLCS